jgi:hypothetical protein
MRGVKRNRATGFPWRNSLLKSRSTVFNEAWTDLFTFLDTHHGLYWIIQDVPEIGGHTLCSCYMGQNKEKEFWHKYVRRRLISWWWPTQKWIRMKPVRISYTSTSDPRMMDCYCQFQIHTLNMQTFYNRCSKCPPYAVKYGAAVLVIFWYLNFWHRSFRFKF